MAINNLRIIYQNLVDVSPLTIPSPILDPNVATGASINITSSSTANVTTTPVTNLAKDAKTLIWRSGLSSTTDVKANLVLTFPSTIIGGIMLPFCNLTSTATIRVRGYTGTAPTLGGTIDVPTTEALGTLIFDSGIQTAAPYQVLGSWSWGTIPLGVNGYSYGGGTYGRCWLPNNEQLACTSLLIEIVDTNTDKYIELSRLVIGAYWSPRFNTSFGLATTTNDSSTHSRTESGDLITTRGTKYSSLTFDLKWLTPADRLDFTRILKGNGLNKPLFISLFPDNSEDWGKEQAHQIYGKLSQLSDIQHPMFGIYSTTIDIEEI